AELAAARTRAIQATQLLRVAQVRLERLMGVTGGAVEVSAARVLDANVAAVPAPSPALPHPVIQSEQAALDLARARETVLSRTDRPRLYLQSSVFARGSCANPDGSVDGGADGLGLERANWAAGVQVVFPNLFDFATLAARRAAAEALTRAESAQYDDALLTITAQQ